MHEHTCWEADVYQGFLTSKCIKFIIHIFGSKYNHDINLFFSNLSEIKTVHFLHKIKQLYFEYKL